MTKPRRTKPTKAELAEAYRILELQEFRMLSLLACYEAFHGTLPDGVFEAVTREATEAQRLSPTNKQGMYERMVNGARHYRASMQIKEIQNAGDVSGLGSAPSFVSNPSIVAPSDQEILRLSRGTRGK